MEATNLKVVRRSNSLLGYGPTFQYGEGMASSNMVFAFFITISIAIGGFLIFFPPVRWLISKIMPPGSGPTPEQRKNGFFSIELFGKSKPDANGKVFSAKCIVKAKGDPGYQGILGSGLIEHSHF